MTENETQVENTESTGEQTSAVTTVTQAAEETNPFRKLASELPTAPEVIGTWGMMGRKSLRKIQDDLDDAGEFLRILADFAEKDSFLANYVNDPENQDDPAVIELTRINADLDQQEEQDKADKQAELDAIEKKYKDRETDRTKAAEEAEKNFLSAKPDLLENVPSETERGEAVMQYDLSRASLALTIGKAISNLSGPTERIDPETGAVIDVKKLLEPIVIPSLKFGAKKKRATGSKSASGEDAWRPRFASATINGAQVPDPRVPGLMKSLGVKVDREKFLDVLDNQFGRENFDKADQGQTFSFTITVNNEVKQVTVTKGNFTSQS